MIAVLISLGTLFVSGINVFLTYKGNKRKIDADVKSKSRIQWIKDVREAHLNYIMAASEYHSFPKDISKRGEFLKCSYTMQAYFPKMSWNPNKKYNNIDIDRINNIIKKYKLTPSKVFQKVGFKDPLTHQESNLINTISNFLLKQDSNEYKNSFISIYYINYHNLIASNLCDDDKFNEIINYINTIIPIYLKIEWDRAKQGK